MKTEIQTYFSAGRATNLCYNLLNHEIDRTRIIYPHHISFMTDITLPGYNAWHYGKNITGCAWLVMGNTKDLFSVKALNKLNSSKLEYCLVLTCVLQISLFYPKFTITSVSRINHLREITHYLVLRCSFVIRHGRLMTYEYINKYIWMTRLMSLYETNEIPLQTFLPLLLYA